MGVTHDLAISVSLALGPAAAPSPGYRLLLIVPLATNSLDGEDFLTVGSVADVAAAQTAGFISAATAGRLNVALAQQPTPDLVYVGAVDLVSLETYPQAFDRLAALLGDQFFYVAIDDRTAAIQVAVSAAVQTNGRALFVFLSDDGDWRTSGLPSAYSAIAGRELTVPIYADDDAWLDDVAYAGALAGVDPTQLSGSPARQLRGLTATNVSVLTAAQRAFVLANANVALPIGSATHFLANGRNANSRAVNEIVTREYLTREITRRVAAQVLALQPAPWPLSATGQAYLRSLLSSLAQEAIAAGHIVDGQVVITTPAITTEDRNLGRLRATFTAQVGTAVVTWQISGTLDREPVVTTE